MRGGARYRTRRGEGREARTSLLLGEHEGVRERDEDGALRHDDAMRDDDDGRGGACALPAALCVP